MTPGETHKSEGIFITNFADGNVAILRIMKGHSWLFKSGNLDFCQCTVTSFLVKHIQRLLSFIRKAARQKGNEEIWGNHSCDVAQVGGVCGHDCARQKPPLSNL